MNIYLYYIIMIKFFPKENNTIHILNLNVITIFFPTTYLLFKLLYPAKIFLFYFSLIYIFFSFILQTINDVITGIITLGTRLYMQKINKGSEKSKSTALVLLNTRAIAGYKSVDEMVKPKSNTPWGNHFAFMQVSIPKLIESELQNPLNFVKKAHRLIKRQKNSAAVYLTGQLLSLVRKVRGHEVRYISFYDFHLILNI